MLSASLNKTSLSLSLSLSLSIYLFISYLTPRVFPAVLSSACPGIDPAIRGTSRSAVVVFGSVRKFVFASGHVERRTEPAADLVDSGRSLDNQKLVVASGTFADTWWFEVLQTTHNLAARYKNNIYTNPLASLILVFFFFFFFFFGGGGGAKGGQTFIWRSQEDGVAMIFPPSHLLCTIKSQMAGGGGGGGAWCEWGETMAPMTPHSYATAQIIVWSKRY